ncbi:MAG: hypothetical protein HOK45_06895 [Verrucomicrobia bacterium]|nr:hypothetical protein [Verrucomicrobiota bacterium]
MSFFKDIILRFVCCIFTSWCMVLAPHCSGEDTSPFFPIGIYGVSNVEDLETVHRAGFNCVKGPSNRAFLDKAASLGMRVIASPESSFDTPEKLKKFHDADSHPALLSWYLVDEPDMQRTPPWKVAMDQRRLKAVPAHSPVSLVLYDGAHSDDYGAIPDILMVDHYPVPWMPLAHFAQHMNWARNAIPQHKPLYGVLQAFNWYYFRRVLPGVTDFRVPTLEELQCMTFMALAEGVDGLIYYTLRSGDWDLLEHPDTWDALQQVIRSVKENEYLLTSERQWWIPAAKIDPFEKRRNAALESSISMTLFKGGDGLKHLLLINTTPHSLTLRIRLPEAAHGWASVFQKDTPFGGFQSENVCLIPFKSYQVRLLKGFEPVTFDLP